MQTKLEKHEYYLRNKDKLKAANKRYQEAHPDRIEQTRKRSARRSRVFRIANPKKTIYKNAVARARKHGIEFTITIDDFEMPETCPYLGIKLESGTYADRKNGAAPTLDRINSELGYIPGNIEIISDLANRMKNNASIEQIITFSKNALKKFGLSWDHLENI